MSSAEVERRVRRVENDVESIYDVFAQIQIVTTRHDSRLREVQAHLVAHDDRLAALEGRLEGVEGRLEGVEGRLEGVEGRLEGVEGRLEGVEGRLTTIQGQLGTVVSLLRGER
ncbi:hypothetical protein [Nocardioides marmoraquaticus]